MDSLGVKKESSSNKTSYCIPETTIGRFEGSEGEGWNVLGVNKFDMLIFIRDHRINTSVSVREDCATRMACPMIVMSRVPRELGVLGLGSWMRPGGAQCVSRGRSSQKPSLFVDCWWS